MALFGGITLPGHPDLNNVRRLDALVSPMLRKMMRAGIAIDREYMWDLGSQFASEMISLSKDITSYIPPEHLDKFVSEAGLIEEEEGDASINPASAEQIGKLLFTCLDLGADKSDKLKRTKQGKLSTGKRQLETLRYDHPVVVKVLQYREVAKLKTTYCNALPDLARFHPRSQCCPVCELKHVDDHWRVHGDIGTTRAATWRFNHKNPNLGNIPTRTDNGQLVQAGFIATPGKILYIRDLSQIELRDLAHLSNCASMIDVYLNDGDLHDDTCHRALGVPWDQKPDKIKHRMAAKRVNFGIQNGTTEKGLYAQLVTDFGLNRIPIPDWLTELWCKEFIESWLKSRPEVLEFFDRMWYLARHYKMVWNPFGFVRLIPEVMSAHSWIREAGLRQAQNLPVTSFAAGHMKLSMARCDHILAPLYEEQSVWPLMTIHDALMFEIDDDRQGDMDELTGWAFDGCMDDVDTGERRFRVPIKSDAESAVRWVK